MDKVVEITPDTSVLQVRVKRERFTQGAQQIPWKLVALHESSKFSEQKGIISFTEYSTRAQNQKFQKQVEVEEKVTEHVERVENEHGQTISEVVSHEVVTEEITTTTTISSSSKEEFYNIEMAVVRLSELQDRHMFQLTLGEPMGDFYR